MSNNNKCLLESSKLEESHGHEHGILRLLDLRTSESGWKMLIFLKFSFRVGFKTESAYFFRLAGTLRVAYSLWLLNFE